MILLLILLNVAHFLGDYTHLSTKTMLEAKKKGSPLMPIWYHALMHTFLFALVLWAYKTETNFWTIELCLGIELISHFAIDVLKGKLNVWFPSVSNPANKIYWYVFGLDQFAHQIIILLIAYLIFL